MKKVLAIALVLILVLSATAFAGMNAGCKVAVHVSTQKKCTGLLFYSCTDIQFTYEGCVGFYVVPVHFGLVGTTVLEGALEWPAGWGTMYFWAQCYGTLAIENWGVGYGEYSYASGVCVYSWAEPACVRYFYYGVPGPGLICPTANQTTGFIGTVDCTTDPEPLPDPATCLFCAGVCGDVGDDPCEPTAVEPSTWGSIKSMFK